MSGILGNVAPSAANAYSQFLGPQEDYQSMFQQAAIDPALAALQKQILPAIQQQYVDANAGSSSALNQALAEAATDVTTNLGSQFLNFFQQQQANKLGALGQLGGLTGQRTFEPMISQQSGILPALLSGATSLAAGGISGGLGINPMRWWQGA